jgi:hypothetical protein
MCGPSLSDGSWAGTFGDAGLFSFDKGKNITTLQGGVIVCRDDELAERLRAIFALLPDGSQLETQVLGYIVSTVEMTAPVLTQALREASPDRWEAKMSTVAEDWIQHGEARGKQLGMTEGMTAGKAALLLRLIERRFGPAPETVRARISAATASPGSTCPPVPPAEIRKSGERALMPAAPRGRGRRRRPARRRPGAVA